MEGQGNYKAKCLFSFLLVSSLFLIPAHGLPAHQFLILRPLGKNPATKSQSSWAEEESQVGALTATETEATVPLRLEHRDALVFNATPEALFNLRLQRDADRVYFLSKMAGSARGWNPRRNESRGQVQDFRSSKTSGLAQNGGEYFTRLGVGSPPTYVFMVLDTGSDIFWTQCSPCRKCYSQTDPIFDPKKSGSYASISCESRLCHRLNSSDCNSNQSCMYQAANSHGSLSTGEFSTETLTFRGTRVAKVALGCGHDNEGLFVGAAGSLGLGRGWLSFPTQTGRRFGGKFSYCLVDRSTKPSSVVFGDSAVSGAAVFTPLLTNPKLYTFYYVELTGISVGGARVPGITASVFKLDAAGNGGVIIDSDTSVTRLTRPAYVSLRDAFRAEAADLKRAPDYSPFDTCFDLSGKTKVKVPTVVMHFRGADVSLPATNYLIPVDSDGVFCFAFAGTMSGGVSILGSIQLQGFRVVFDVAGSRVGFDPSGCN